MPVWGYESPTPVTTFIAPPAACPAGSVIPPVPDNGQTPVTGVASPATFTNYPNYTWDEETSTYISAGTSTITIVTEQVQFGPAVYAGSESWMMAVFPKTDEAAVNIKLIMQAIACHDGESTARVNIECPQQLPSISVSNAQSTVDDVCIASVPGNIFVYHAPGAKGTTNLFTQPLDSFPETVYPSNFPNLNDFVFQDANAVTYAQAGYYRYYDIFLNEERYFQVDQYGVIIQTQQQCIPPEPATPEVVSCGDALVASGEGPGTYKILFNTGANTGVIVFRAYTGIQPDGILLKHYDINGNEITTRNAFSCSGHSPGYNCSGDLWEADFDTTGATNTGGNLGFGSRNTSSGGGANMPYPTSNSMTNNPTVSEPVFMGRLDIGPTTPADECTAAQAGSVKYPYVFFNGQNWGLNPNNLCPLNTSVYGKNNLPPNGAHQLGSDTYGALASSASDSQMPNVNYDTQQTIIDILTPYPINQDVVIGQSSFGPIYGPNLDQPIGEQEYVYPACTVLYEPGFAGPDGTGLYTLYTYSNDLGGWDETPPNSETTSTNNSGYITIKPRQVQVNSLHPGMIHAALKKANATDEVVEVTVQSLFCSSSFLVWLECANLISLLDSGGVIPLSSGINGQPTFELACAAPLTPGNDMYVIHGAYERDGSTYKLPGVGGSGLNKNLPYLGDLAFSNDTATNIKSEGFYSYFDGATRKVMHVDNQGVIDQILIC